MILSEHRSTSRNSLPKLDSSEDEFEIRRDNAKRAHSPGRGIHLRLSLDAENDDDDERLARRKSRLLEPHPASVSSPCSNGDSSRRRAEAAAPRGISQAQIGEHYGNCIRLAAENKITAKNAFNLHLIDYMSIMLKNEDYASFQIASSSLDAGAKIYAGRVDAVHQETYQVLTGLGRSDVTPANVNTDAPDETAFSDVLDNNQAKADQRKKTHAPRDIIQKQLNKIRSKALVSKADVDPLFQHQTSSYDDGGISELGLNQLRTLDESCVLILDSSTRVIQSPHQSKADMLKIGGIYDCLHSVLPNSASQLIICPSLSSFLLSKWNPDETADSSFHLDRHDSVLLHEDHPSSLVAAADADDNDEPALDFPVSDDSVGMADKTLVAPTACSPVVEAASLHMSNNMTTDGELFVSSLKSMLDKQYEHFGQINDHILGMWAGPEHWRKKAKRRKVDVITGLEGDADLDEISPLSHNQNCGKTGRKPRRGKKSLAAVLDYKTAMEPSENRTRNGHLARKTWCKSELSEGLPNSSAPNATVFKDAYRQKATGQLNLLPSEWTDTRNTLYQLCNREVILKTNNLSGSRLGAPPNEQDTLGPHPQTTASAGYDFDWIHRHPEDDQLVIGGNSEQLSEPPDSPIGIGDDDDDDDLDHLPPYAGVFTQDINTQVDNAVIDGIDLVAQPRKIARIEIGYARTAKMINVHRLKAVMWDFLEASFSPTSPNPAQSPPTSTGESSSQSQKTVTFSSLVATLPDRLSWQMVKELSVPIALNCLLHLANEKDMFFMCTENLTDVLISRGLPDSELEALESYRLSSESNETDLPPSKASRTEGNRSKKHKRPRSSTLDSWLADSDPSVQTPC